jgi:hypothetical protein
MRNDRRPKQKIGQQGFERHAIVRLGRPLSIFVRVSCKPEKRSGPLSFVPQCPIATVRINQVREVLELLPLFLAVGVAKPRRVRAEIALLQFDVAADQAIDIDGHVRPGTFLAKLCFGSNVDVLSHRGAYRDEEVLDGFLELILGVGKTGKTKFSCQCIAEAGKGGVNIGLNRISFTESRARSLPRWPTEVRASTRLNPRPPAED